MAAVSSLWGSPGHRISWSKEQAALKAGMLSEIRGQDGRGQTAIRFTSLSLLYFNISATRCDLNLIIIIIIIINSIRAEISKVIFSREITSGFRIWHPRAGGYPWMHLQDTGPIINWAISCFQFQRSRIYPQELLLKKDIDDFTNITFFPWQWWAVSGSRSTSEDNWWTSQDLLTVILTTNSQKTSNYKNYTGHWDKISLLNNWYIMQVLV